MRPICNWVWPETSSFCVSTGLFCWLKPLFVCRFRSANCDMQFVKKRVLKLVIAPIFHSSMVSVDLILMKIEDPVFLSERRSGDANCCYPSLIVLYFSSCHRLGAFNSFKLVFIIIMHFLHFNSSMQVPGVGNWSLGRAPSLHYIIYWGCYVD